MMQPDTNCDKCGLHETCKTPCMESSGADDPLVLVCGEAPGSEEDEKGIPFVGRSGRLLREALEEFFDVKTEVRFTNVVRCRPPDNKITKRAINYCKHRVIAEIENYDPDLVLLLGNSPLNAILGESGITVWNGVVVERDDRVYVPLFHPAYILRNKSAMSDWLDALYKAEQALVVGESRGDASYEYTYPLSLAEVVDMKEHLSQCEWIAYDTETSCLDPYGEDAAIIVVSFASAEKAYAIPMNHPEMLWDDDEFETIISIIQELVTHEWLRKVVGHNIKYDQVWTYARYGFWFEPSGDTMLVSHLLDSRKGIHSLKRLAGLHLGMYDYDGPLKSFCRSDKDADVYRGGSYANVPLNILLPYAAMDASATYMLHAKLFPTLTQSQKTLYEQLIMPASNALARVQDNGIAIDDYVADRYTTIYTIRQQELYVDIMDHKAVQLLSVDKQKELDLDNRMHPKRKPRHFHFNPNSYPQLRDLYYDYCAVPVPKERTDTGLPTTKASILKPLEDKFPIIGLIRYYKLLTKMIGTYLEPAASGKWASADGRVRCSFNLHGTQTGRLSSSNPNLQNIPTPEKEPGTLLEILPIKNVFTHTFPDGVLMSADYSGMELRVFASLADSKDMMDMHKSGKDFHSVVAFMVRDGMSPDDVTHEMIADFRKYENHVRYRYKWTNWTLLYGGGAPTLHNMYGIPLDEAEEAVRSYYAAFPDVRRFQDELISKVKTDGYIESPFGRRAYYPYINDRDGGRASKARRSALNMPIQSSASDITLMALVIIDRAIQQDGLRTMIVNTVHDSIILDVPEDEVDTVANLCISIMETIKEHALFYMPNIDMTWLQCPLKADIEVGTHYGAEEPYSR